MYKNICRRLTMMSTQLKIVIALLSLAFAIVILVSLLPNSTTIWDQRAATQDLHPGDPCLRPCPMIYKPVCGTDGVTYSNQCAMEVKICQDKTPITVDHEGPCYS